MGLLKEINQQGLEVQIDLQAFIAKFLKTTVEHWSWPGCHKKKDLEPSISTIPTISSVKLWRQMRFLLC